MYLLWSPYFNLQASIDDQTNPGNRSETQRQRADLIAERREARYSLNKEHRAQREDLNNQSSDSITVGEDRIAELVQEDKENFAAQHEEITEHIDQSYLTFMNTPIIG